MEGIGGGGVDFFYAFSGNEIPDKIPEVSLKRIFKNDIK